MNFRDGDLLPENQEPLIITPAPYGPSWRPDDYAGEISVTWDEQVQAAVECYEAGATVLHIHVRCPSDHEDRYLARHVGGDAVQPRPTPNRPDGQPGFLVYDTGRHLPQPAGRDDRDPLYIL